MQLKSIIMDESAVLRSMKRITHEIIEKNNGAADLILLGIYRRGMPLAAILQENIRNFEGTEVPLGSIDISLYRDDLSEMNTIPESGSTHIPCDISGKRIILVDDVMYTGRTVRAAIEAVMDYGRPKSIKFVSLIDRGLRELPIHPDIVGKVIETSPEDQVAVFFKETDGEDKVVLG